MKIKLVNGPFDGQRLEVPDSQTRLVFPRRNYREHTVDDEGFAAPTSVIYVYERGEMSPTGDVAFNFTRVE